MLFSSVQDRFSIGAYQNKLHDKLRGNSTSLAQSINPYRSAIPTEISHLGSAINSIVNSHDELNRASCQTTAPRQGIAAPLLMLLSQIRLNDSPFSSAPPAFFSDRDNGLSPPVSRTAHPDNSGNGLSAMLGPVANALYEAGEFIVRHDPLRFPEADAATLSSGVVDSTTATDIAKNINESRYLSDDIFARTVEIISAIEDGEDSIAMNDILDKLDCIAIEAEEKWPSDTTEKINVDRLIYLIEKSDNIIFDFEIKFRQKIFCNQLRMQFENYIKTAVDITNKEDISKFKKFIGKIPTLKLTPDSRGEGYPPIESQIAGNLVSSVYWFENAEGYSATHGLRYAAHKATLTYLIAEKGLGDLNKFPENWYTGAEAMRLVDILYRELENNLKNKGGDYLLRSARQFYSSLCEFYIGDSTLNIRGLHKKKYRPTQIKISYLR